MKTNLKTIGTVITVAAIIVIALTVSASSISQPMKEVKPANDAVNKQNVAPLRPLYDLNNIGKDATLSEVMASTKLGQPTYQPMGTSKPQVKLSVDGNLAALIYTNTNLARINYYQQDVQLVILAERDGSSYKGFENYLKIRTQPTTVTIVNEDGTQHTTNATGVWIGLDRIRQISVAGNPGYGYDPMDTPIQDSGRVQWWSKDGIHYEVIANLPMQELLKIAESVQHT